MSLLMAYLLPLLAGTGLYAAGVEWPRRMDAWLRALGYGYLIGLALVALLTAVFRPMPQSVWSVLWLPVFALALAAMAAARWRWRRKVVPAMTAASSMEPVWSRWLLLFLGVWLLVRTLSLWGEIDTRDLFAWDAWATWSVKAKVWYLDNTWWPFVDEASWLADPDSRYLAAWYYPGSLGLLEVWFASAQAGWRTPGFAAMWPLAWLAAMAITVGQLRALSLPWWQATTAATVWASLPLVNTHAALVGYADLPMTVMLAASGLALARYSAGQGRAHLVLALALALLLPGLKLEGAFWLLLLLFAALVAVLSNRRGWLLGTLVAIVLWTLFFGLHLPLPGLGWVDIGWGHLRAPAVGVDQALIWRAVGPEIAQAMLLAPNWHLLWWLSAPVLLLTWRGCLQHTALSWLCLVMLVSILAIFCFTDAAVWAQDLTAMNRVLMHVTLLWVCWLALLINGRLEACGTAAPVFSPQPESGTVR